MAMLVAIISIVCGLLVTSVLMEIRKTKRAERASELEVKIMDKTKNLLKCNVESAQHFYREIYEIDGLISEADKLSRYSPLKNLTRLVELPTISNLNPKQERIMMQVVTEQTIFRYCAPALLYLGRNFHVLDNLDCYKKELEEKINSRVFGELGS